MSTVGVTARMRAARCRSDAMTATSAPAPETLHPSLWRASQLARADVRCIDTGHVALSGQL
ncbi:hypothetical protein FPK44_21730, partial [Acinetobacter baumannii]|nr:hypothetical protein [Acinetobacter baumannii]